MIDFTEGALAPDASAETLTLELSASQMGRLRQAAASAGLALEEFAAQAALARAASELTEDYVTRISPEGMARLLAFQSCSQRPLRPREAAQAYAAQAPLRALANPQLRLDFDEAHPARLQE